MDKITAEALAAKIEALEPQMRESALLLLDLLLQAQQNWKEASQNQDQG